MRLRNIAVIVVFQLATPLVVAAEQNSEQHTLNAPPTPPQSLQEPYTDLFPSTGNTTPVAGNQKNVQSQPPAPTYESWDVLRQYPRYVPLPTPVIIEDATEQP